MDGFYEISAHRPDDSAVIEACARLFSNHYGEWASGGRVRLSAGRLSKLFLTPNADNHECKLITARSADEIIGSCLFARFEVEVFGRTVRVSWITQLVVHSAFRRRGVATRLAERALKGANFGAIVSSNPAAVSALKRAAARSGEVGVRNCEAVARAVVGAGAVTYAPAHAFEWLPTPPRGFAAAARAHTNFHIRHDEAMAAADELGEKWPLGHPIPGTEFFALFAA